MKKANINKNKIVVVDNEPMVTQCLIKLFDSEGFDNVITFNNPEDAFLWLKDNNADLIISDYNMPQMNGVDFLAKVKELYPKAIRILFASYITKEELIRAINEAGIQKYIEKPWDNEVLINYVKTVSYRRKL